MLLSAKWTSTGTDHGGWVLDTLPYILLNFVIYNHLQSKTTTIITSANKMFRSTKQILLHSLVRGTYKHTYLLYQHFWFNPLLRILLGRTAPLPPFPSTFFQSFEYCRRSSKASIIDPTKEIFDYVHANMIKLEKWVLLSFKVI